MSSYGPPASRMRQIKRDAPPRKPHFPQNVDEAIEEAVEEASKAQEVGEEVAEEIRVPVGAVDAVITPGPDEKFGTDDDEYRIEGHKHEHKGDKHDKDEEPEAEPVVEDEPEAGPGIVQPEYEKAMKKSDLVAIAEAHGVEVEDTMTKAQIIAALDKHFA